MELRQIEQFVAVAEERSFTRAAARLSYVQSSLSASIAGLERELGVRLFERNTRRVSPTPTAEAILPVARELLATAERLKDIAGEVSGVLRGTLRIGMMQSMRFIDVPALLGEFHRAHPGVQMQLHSAAGGSAELLRELRSGVTDLAFIALPEIPAGIDAYTLMVEELRLVGRPEAPLLAADPAPLAEIAEADLVEFPTGWGVRTVVDRAFAQHGLMHTAHLEVADTRGHLDMLREGLGLGGLPISMIPQDEPRLRSVAIAPTLSWRVVMAQRADRPSSPAARALAELVTRTHAGPP